MKNYFLTVYLLFLVCSFGFCQKVQIAHLSKGETREFAAIKETFKKNNPGYDMAYLSDTKKVFPKDAYRVLFVQQGGGTATILKKDKQTQKSKITVGDIVMLEQKETLQVDSAIALLVFTVPKEPQEPLPDFIRPDWDPKITDTPGGCATATNAYRRILLTWKSEVGSYLFHALNAHRVRITDSFSHYHPLDKGFDEFYLVQMAQPEAKIITSEHVELITNPSQIRKQQTESLMEEHSLEVGDLVYLPKGVVHRGVGNVLAQVITVPGFVPGSEIGVDHHLKFINEKFHLTGDKAIPLNVEASQSAVVK